MRTPPLLADFTHARACKLFCEKYLTLPDGAVGISILLHLLLLGSDGAGVDGAVWSQELLQLFQRRGVGFEGIRGETFGLLLGEEGLYDFRSYGNSG